MGAIESLEKCEVPAAALRGRNIPFVGTFGLSARLGTRGMISSGMGTEAARAKRTCLMLSGEEGTEGIRTSAAALPKL